MSPAEFQALALSLREAGAVKVRCGDLEVIWPGPYTPSADARQAFNKARAGSNGKHEAPQPANAEEARLLAYRRELNGEDDD